MWHSEESGQLWTPGRENPWAWVTLPGHTAQGLSRLCFHAALGDLWWSEGLLPQDVRTPPSAAEQAARPASLAGTCRESMCCCCPWRTFLLGTLLGHLTCAQRDCLPQGGTVTALKWPDQPRTPLASSHALV